MTDGQYKAKRKRRKCKTLVYNTPYRKLNIEKHEHYKNTRLNYQAL